MAELTCTTLKGFGLKTFCVQDYATNIEGRHSRNNKVPLVKESEHFAGLIVFDNDSTETIRGFLEMCIWSKPSIVCVDFSNMTDQEKIKQLEELIDYEIGDWYFDLESYEQRFAYGLAEYYRTDIGYGHDVKVDDKWMLRL